MKRIIIILLAMVPFVYGCKKDEISPSTTELNKVREIAWNSIEQKGKVTVKTSWLEADVVETTYNNREV